MNSIVCLIISNIRGIVCWIDLKLRGIVCLIVLKLRGIVCLSLLIVASQDCLFLDPRGSLSVLLLKDGHSLVQALNVTSDCPSSFLRSAISLALEETVD